ncbi:MAG: magnesium transporter [Deltaproteobacteria bacterium]|nr:magnesium transporter [Deltaproteobacteria bacterium]
MSANSSLDRMDNDDLEAVLRADDATATSFLRLLPHPADVVESLRAVEIAQWPRLLRLVADEAERAEAVALLEEPERQALLILLDPGEIGELVKNLETDDATDVIEDLDPQEQREALQSLAPAERAQVEELLQFAPDTAGGLMQTELAGVRKAQTVQDAIARVRELVEQDIAVHFVYVVDDDERLVGAIDVAHLLVHRGDKSVTQIMEPPVAKVTPDVDQEQVAGLFKKYSIVSLPVVDREGRLLGRILHDDVIHVVSEEAEEDALKQAGTSAEELLYRDRVLPIARVRLPWLITTLLGSLISASLIAFFSGVIAQAVVLAAFVPVITAMGGNVGTQSATILTRGLATGRVSLTDLARILFREFRVGLVMGAVCGVVVGGAGTFLFGDGNPVLGLIVFLAMLAAMTAAATVGALAPAAMKRVGVDPAIASGPFVTTANDIVGIVIYMSTALAFLDLLKTP